MPLESVVEREPLHFDGVASLRLRRDMGLYLQRLLREAGMTAAALAWATRCPFRYPPGVQLDDETREWFDDVIGRVPDGRVLTNTVARVLAGTEDVPVVPGEREVLQAWQSARALWTHMPTEVHDTWDPEHLEYRMSTAAVLGTNEVVLRAPEYVEGELDWYAFDVGGPSLGLTGQSGIRRLYRVPVALEFAGMPNSRFWTFEDPGVNFDTLELLTREQSPTSAVMMALEYALSYGDDWYLLSLPLEPHMVCELTQVIITDCFGDAVAAQPPAGRWNLFRHDDGQGGLSTVFFNASPGQVLEGEALEELHLLRDEQANVAWAVEAVVQHPVADGRPVAAPPPATRESQPEGLTWTLAPSYAPRNWFPLVPSSQHIGRLAVGRQWTARDAQPAGRVLGALGPGKRVHDEEVPSEGVQITRRWQATRAVDGTLHLWVGRMKTPRQTEVPPGVRFDVVERGSSRVETPRSTLRARRTLFAAAAVKPARRR